MPDRLVPMTVDAEVRGGVVTLTGTANWQYSGDEAEFLRPSGLKHLPRPAMRPRSGWQ